MTWLLLINLLQVKDFNIAKQEEDISYYAGFVGELIPLQGVSLMYF